MLPSPQKSDISQSRNSVSKKKSIYFEEVLYILEVNNILINKYRWRKDA